MAHSDDFRKRVVEAVFQGGMSRNAAAERFEVSIASAVRWALRFLNTCGMSPTPTGGDRRSARSMRIATVCSGSFVASRISRCWKSRSPDRHLRRALLLLGRPAFFRSPRDHIQKRSACQRTTELAGAIVLRTLHLMCHRAQMPLSSSTALLRSPAALLPWSDDADFPSRSKMSFGWLTRGPCASALVGAPPKVLTFSR